jgi:hypothetical protein
MNTGKLLTYLKPGASCEMLVHLNATFFWETPCQPESVVLLLETVRGKSTKRAGR